MNGSDVPHACILFGVFGVDCNVTVNAEVCHEWGCAVPCLLCNISFVGWSVFFQRGVGFSQARSLEKFHF